MWTLRIESSGGAIAQSERLVGRFDRALLERHCQVD